MLPLQATVDLGVMTIKGYSAFPKARALLKPHHQVVQWHISRTLVEGGLNPCRYVVGVFYTPAD